MNAIEMVNDILHMQYIYAMHIYIVYALIYRIYSIHHIYRQHDNLYIHKMIVCPCVCVCMCMHMCVSLCAHI